VKATLTPGQESGVFLLLIIALVIYMLPWLVAVQRRHRDRLAIGILNLFLGWSLLGWVGAFVWAASADVEDVEDVRRRRLTPAGCFVAIVLIVVAGFIFLVWIGAQAAPF
jgi:hypothetical protein